MRITVVDKISLLISVLKEVYRLPNIRIMLSTLTNPIDSTRYVEFTFIINCMKKYGISFNHALDVSSPFMLAYLFSKKKHITKTDINSHEEKVIFQSETLEFRLEDATGLSFTDNQFDFVYSVSVIEHIYGEYINAISEMIRVAKPKSYIYITFPVSKQHVEEWIDTDIYSNQFKQQNSLFFQYRFNEDDVFEIIAKIGASADVVENCIYWERVDGRYDRVMNLLRFFPQQKQLQTLLSGVVNFFSGLTLLKNEPHGFETATSFGNLSLLLRKK